VPDFFHSPEGPFSQSSRQMVKRCNLHLVSKLRYDSALF